MVEILFSPEKVPLNGSKNKLVRKNAMTFNCLFKNTLL